MLIDFYKFDGERNKLNKTLTPIYMSYNVTLKNDKNILAPSFTIPDADFNYLKAIAPIESLLAYIPEYGRYYYVNPSIDNLAGITTINCNVDVLTTYKNDLLLEKGFITRAQNGWNAYLQDNQIPVLEKRNNIVKVFPNTLGNSPSMVITLLG